MLPHVPEELIRFIEAAGESTNIDAKGPMEWDGAEASAGLTKDILSLANCRDGGVIVVGKEEPEPGKFVLTGLTEQQAASFETTKVATWVNNHGSPPVHLVCHRLEHQNCQVVVIAVSEFHDVPVICTKLYEVSVPGKASKVLLRKGAIYVRTANAESAPLSSVEEMRGLIGLATAKRGDQMLSMFQAMLKGRSLLEPKPDEAFFRDERQLVQSALTTDLGDQAEQGAWTFICHPVRYQADRWQEPNDLKKIVDASAVRIRREYPPVSHELHIRDWGICNHYSDDWFGLTRSGLFTSVRLFRENRTTFKNPWQPNPDIPAGQWLDFRLNISLVIEFFMFLSRFAKVFEVGEELECDVSVGPLTGRRLATMDSRINLDPTQPCKSNSFRRKSVIAVESLQTSWEDECAKILHGFLELFVGFQASRETMRTWVDNFRDRKMD